MTTTLDIGKQLVELCRQGKNLEAIDKLYSKDVVSVEPQACEGMPAEIKGKEAVRGKTQWWLENFECHSTEILGPFPKGDQFAILYKVDVTHKSTKQRSVMEEICLYTVKNGQIVRDEFFYLPQEKK
jgi:hypothetical protein